MWKRTVDWLPASSVKLRLSLNPGPKAKEDFVSISPLGAPPEPLRVQAFRGSGATDRTEVSNTMFVPLSTLKFVGAVTVNPPGSELKIVLENYRSIGCRHKYCAKGHP